MKVDNARGDGVRAATRRLDHLVTGFVDDQQIITRTAVQQVVKVAATTAVIATVAIQAVAVGGAIQHVQTRAAIDPIGTGAAVHLVIADIGMNQVVAGTAAKPDIGVAARQRVIAHAAIDLVVVVATIQTVIAVDAPQRVIAAQAVVVRSPVKHILPSAAKQGVIPTALLSDSNVICGCLWGIIPTPPDHFATTRSGHQWKPACPRMRSLVGGEGDAAFGEDGVEIGEGGEVPVDDGFVEVEFHIVLIGDAPMLRLASSSVTLICCKPDETARKA